MHQEEILSRRTVLRGALAVGCSLLIPAALLGCDAKQGETPSTEPASPASSGSETATPGKVTQASVQYQSQPKGEQKCGVCMHFEAGSNSCKLVDGQISPDGWCSLWAKMV